MSRPPGQKPSGRKRGGQPGHRRHDRIQLASDEIVDVKPETCRRCGEPLLCQVFEGWSKVRARKDAVAAKTLLKFGSKKTAATCREIFDVESSLWMFARVTVEPTKPEP